ncbi:MAG TPA: histidine phosphatase family protein [Anaerolineales bacterium]|nr:histidine phosphatase family protein [Anaerolineales bacterium]
MMFQSPPSPPCYTITLLRHGQSVGNAQGLHQGQADFPLSPRGQEQARLLQERWQKEGRRFDLVISSTLARARQTAEIIAQGLGAPIELDSNWMERDNGQLSGLHPDQTRASRPPFIHLYQPIGQTGESQWELYLRAGQAIQSLLEHTPGQYLVVSHGAILNMALYAILGITPSANFIGPRFRFQNTSFATLTYHPGEHRWTLLGINDTAHLPEAER